MERIETLPGADAPYMHLANLYDVLMRDVDYDAWAGYVLGLLREYGVTEGASVFDCACGTGALTLRLAQAGYRAVGFDCAEAMLERAQRNARAAGLRIPFVCQDMRRLSTHHPAEAVTCACDGVNYLTSVADAEAFFHSAYAALMDNGLLLFDVSSAYKLECVLGGQTYGEDLPECAYLWRNVFDPQSRLLEMDLTFFLPDAEGRYLRLAERHVQRAHSVRELNNALARAGFEVLAIYEAFTRRGIREEAERIQFVARKIACEQE